MTDLEKVPNGISVSMSWLRQLKDDATGQLADDMQSILNMLEDTKKAYERVVDGGKFPVEDDYGKFVQIAEQQLHAQTLSTLLNVINNKL